MKKKLVSIAVAAATGGWPFIKRGYDLVGLAGLPGDIAAWATFLGLIFGSYAVVDWLLLAVAIVALAYIVDVLPPLWLLQKRRDAQQPLEKDGSPSTPEQVAAYGRPTAEQRLDAADRSAELDSLTAQVEGLDNAIGEAFSSIVERMATVDRDMEARRKAGINMVNSPENQLIQEIGVFTTHLHQLERTAGRVLVGKMPNYNFEADRKWPDEPDAASTERLIQFRTVAAKREWASNIRAAAVTEINQIKSVFQMVRRGDPTALALLRQLPPNIGLEKPQ